jgi:hypothetical protein
MSELHEMGKRFLYSGNSPQSLHATLTIGKRLSPEEAAKVTEDIYADLADDVTKLDVLLQLGLNFRQREHAIEELSARLKKDDAPASSFNTHRLYLNDQVKVLQIINETREKQERNRCVPAEQKAQQEEERRESDERLFQHRGMTRDKGYYYVPGVDMEQPECNLDPDTIARRDVVRMRHLPKSPYEDRILAEEYQATFEVENKIDKEKLSKKEMPCDEYRDIREVPQPKWWDEKRRLTNRLTIERAWAWNNAMERAEAHVEAIDRSKGRPWICACCKQKNTQHLTDGWVEGPEPKEGDDPWIGKMVTVVVKTLLWGVVLGWLLSSLILGQPARVFAHCAEERAEDRATALPPLSLDVPAMPPAKPCDIAETLPKPTDCRPWAAGAIAAHDFAHSSRAVLIPERWRSRGTVADLVQVPHTLKRELQLDKRELQHPPDPFFSDFSTAPTQ